MKNLQYIKEALDINLSHLKFSNHLDIKLSGNIMDSITIRFTVQKKEDWANGIWQNADYVLIHICAIDTVTKKELQRENGVDYYEADTNVCRVLPKMRMKKGNSDAIISHVTKYFMSITI